MNKQYINGKKLNYSKSDTGAIDELETKVTANTNDIADLDNDIYGENGIDNRVQQNTTSIGNIQNNVETINNKLNPIANEYPLIAPFKLRTTLNEVRSKYVEIYIDPNVFNSTNISKYYLALFTCKPSRTKVNDLSLPNMKKWNPCCIPVEGGTAINKSPYAYLIDAGFTSLTINLQNILITHRFTADQIGTWVKIINLDAIKEYFIYDTDKMRGAKTYHKKRPFYSIAKYGLGFISDETATLSPSSFKQGLISPNRYNYIHKFLLYYNLVDTLSITIAGHNS